ncbi:MAG: MarC family protein [Verrucomicrobiaceae bacterium]|nr:MAG: MarC family protein [Verrucomicrobiaceae bacterium]
MNHWLEQFLLAFIPLFVAIDPIGLIPVYMSMASNVPSEERNTVVVHAVSTAFLVGVGFLFLGRLLFTALNITEADFQIAGGLILLAVAGQELLGTDARNQFASRDFGVVPLGMPMIAGPGMLTGVLALSDTVGTLITLTALVSNLVIIWFALRFSEAISHKIGATAMRAISRFVALLLAAIAINLIRRGIQSV